MLLLIVVVAGALHAHFIELAGALDEVLDIGLEQC